MFKRIGIGVLCVVGLIWLNNTSLLFGPDAGAAAKLLAHRGVHQIYVGEARDNDTCRAGKIAPLTHDLIENTIPSMRAAFEAGAAVVELDVHLVADGHFVVFHDWELDCQTDGTGVTYQQSLAYLRGLDLGYGFTSDGAHFPLRGRPGNRMPTLVEVLDAGLDGSFLINFKSRRAEEGRALVKLLEEPRYRAQVFGIYGGEPPTEAVLEAVPQMRGYHRAGLKRCLIRYGLLGWSGYVPQACRSGLVAVPIDYGPWLWGWPHRFEARMKAAGSEVILLGPYDGSGFSSGIEDAAVLAEVPDGFGGYIWSNRAEVIGPLIAE